MKMSRQVNDITQRQAALIAGFGLLFMFISGYFGTSPDYQAIYDSVFDSQSKLRTNVVGDIMMLVFDVIAALGLYVYLKPVNKSISLLAAWFRLMHIAIYSASLITLILVIDLINGAESLTVANTQQLNDQVLMLLKGHEYGFRIGLVFFGFHFLILGYLVFKSGYIPQLIGALLIFAAFGYLANSFASILMPDYEEYKSIVQGVSFIPAILAELSLCLWLIWKGK